MTKIIAFTGYKETGKTTAANYLVENHGFVRHNFKDALIAEIKEKFPDLLREIQAASEYSGLGGNGNEKVIAHLFEIKPPLIRALMQNYGTEVRRGDKDSYWTDQWVKKLWELEGIHGDIKVVTDDVRFLNEALAIKSRGGTIIRLTRPDLPTGGDHKSETEQDEIEADYTIVCEPGNLEKLYTDLEKIVSSR